MAEDTFDGKLKVSSALSALKAVDARGSVNLDEKDKFVNVLYDQMNTISELGPNMITAQVLPALSKIKSNWCFLSSISDQWVENFDPISLIFRIIAQSEDQTIISECLDFVNHITSINNVSIAKLISLNPAPILSNCIHSDAFGSFRSSIQIVKRLLHSDSYRDYALSSGLFNDTIGELESQFQRVESEGWSMALSQRIEDLFDLIASSVWKFSPELIPSVLESIGQLIDLSVSSEIYVSISKHIASLIDAISTKGQLERIIKNGYFDTMIDLLSDPHHMEAYQYVLDLACNAFLSADKGIITTLWEKVKPEFASSLIGRFFNNEKLLPNVLTLIGNMIAQGEEALQEFLTERFIINLLKLASHGSFEIRRSVDWVMWGMVAVANTEQISALMQPKFLDFICSTFLSDDFDLFGIILTQPLPHFYKLMDEASLKNAEPWSTAQSKFLDVLVELKDCADEKVSKEAICLLDKYYPIV